MKPDLIINGLTSMDDLIELIEDSNSGQLELYTITTILNYFNQIGLPEAGTALLTAMTRDGSIFGE